MRVIITRRSGIALLSGLTLIVVMAAMAYALSQRGPLAGATTATTARRGPSVTYRVSVTSTPVSAVSPGSPVTEHGVRMITPTTGGGRATPAPTPASLSGGPVASPTPGDASVVVGSFAERTSSVPVIVAQVQMRNIGTTTWRSDWSYYIGCVFNCMNGNKLPTGGATPGQVSTFDLQLFPPSALSVATYASQWSMFHSLGPGMPAVRFGELATVQITVINALPLDVETAPGCDSGNTTWVVDGGACANGALALTTNSTQEPTVTLQNAPAGFDGANFTITVHAVFKNAPGAWVRLISYVDTSDCAGQGVDVRSDGSYRDIFVSNCAVQDGGDHWTATPFGTSAIGITFIVEDGVYTFDLNGQFIEDGGSLAGGYPVISVGGPDGSIVNVAGVELDYPVPYTAQWVVS